MGMKRTWLRIFLLLALVLGVAFTVTAVLRGKRLFHTAKDWRKELRYLIESGGTIGEVPAAEAFETGYLQAVFGGDPELLGKLRGVISKGLAEDPTLNLGEVAAMLVTYRTNGDGHAEDVVAHIIGGFPLGRRKPGFHRDGYFRAQIDKNLWESGNSALAFLGRDIVLFADESIVSRQQNVLESILSGNVLPLVDMIKERPLYFTAVLPDPRRAVPPQLRPHVQALIAKGHLSTSGGSYDITILTPNPEAASYTLSMLYDMKLASQLALQGRFQGVVLKEAWGDHIPVWWAHEMFNNMQRVTMEKQQNIVRMHLDFERVMVNATLKSIERMGRDMLQTRGSMEEKLDPRLVDAGMTTRKPLHYWSEEHRWGPDWPIAPPSSNAAPGEADTRVMPTAPAVSPSE